MIANLKTCDVYIGSACDLYTRFHVHLSKLRSGIHHSSKLQHSWNKHGAETFVFTVVEFVEDRSLLERREQHWIDETNSAETGYNMQPKAENASGYKLTEETKRKISLKAMGRVLSPERRAQISMSRIGTKRNDATKQKLRIASTGRSHSAETRMKLQALATGRKQSPETIEKRVSKLRGKKLSAERIAKSAASRVGGKRSAESKRRMSIAQTEVMRKNPLKRNSLGHFLSRDSA